MHAGRYADKHADRQMYGQTNVRADIQTDGQTDWYSYGNNQHIMINPDRHRDPYSDTAVLTTNVSSFSQKNQY